MVCIVYKIINSANNKLYIGQTWRTIKKRFIEHCKPSQKGCRKLHRAIQKYGRVNFTIVPLVFCEHQQDADCVETFFIDKLNTISNGYNLKTGGSYGRHSEETKRKISLANTGKPPTRKGALVSEETRIKLRLANTGTKCSEETKEKISLANKGRTSPRKGVVLDENAKRKMSLGSGQRKLSTQNVIEVIQMWESGHYKQKDIANKFGVDQTSISRIVNKKSYKFES